MISAQPARFRPRVDSSVFEAFGPGTPCLVWPIGTHMLDNA